MTNKINPKYVGRYLGIPLFPTCTIWLMLDRLQASSAVAAVIWTLWTLLAIAIVTVPFTENWVHPSDLPKE